MLKQPYQKNTSSGKRKVNFNLLSEVAQTSLGTHHQISRGLWSFWEKIVTQGRGKSSVTAHMEKNNLSQPTFKKNCHNTPVKGKENNLSQAPMEKKVTTHSCKQAQITQLAVFSFKKTKILRFDRVSSQYIKVSFLARSTISTKPISNVTFSQQHLATSI